MNYKIVLVFFILSFSGIAQSTINSEEDKIALEEVFNELEELYAIHFSYVADIIIQEEALLKKEGTLKEKLLVIQNQTSLIFKKIDEQNYVVLSQSAENNFRICGNLYSTANKKPIKNAEVTTANNTFFNTSDENGFFELFLTDIQDTVFFQHSDFQIKTVEAKELFKKDTCKDVFLDEAGYKLEEVFITDYLTNNSLYKKAINQIRIDPNQIGVLPSLVEPDVLELLQILPGVQSSNETASDLFIRGGNPDQNLVLWDGIRMYSSGHFFGSFSSYNPYVTEDVKLIRGGTDPQYGGAVSGIVDISSTDIIPEHIKGGGGLSLTHGDVFLKAPIAKNLGLIVSGRRSYVDLVQTGTYNNYLNRSLQNTTFFQNKPHFFDNEKERTTEYYFADITGKLIWNVSKNDKIRASFIYNENDTFYTFRALEDGSRGFTSKDQIDEIKIINNGVSFIWNHDWSPNLSHTISSYYSYFKNQFLDDEKLFSGEPFDPDNLSFRSDYESTNRVSEINSFFGLDWKINAFLGLKSGFQISDINTKLQIDEIMTTVDEMTPYTDLYENTNFTRSIFSDFKIAIKDRFSANVGIRLNDFSIYQNPELDKLYKEPRIRVQGRINNRLQARLSYDQKYQMMIQESFFEGIEFRVPRNIWLLADDEYGEPLMSEQWSFGFIYRKKNLDIDVDVYHKRISNLFTFSRGFEQLPVFDIGESKNIGLDVLIKKRFKKYQTWISYSLSSQRSTYADLNNGDAFIGNFDTPNRFSWIHRFQFDKLEFSLGWNYRTGAPYSSNVTLAMIDEEDPDFNLEAIEFGTLNNARLPDYHRLDITGTYKFKFSKRSKLRGKIALSLLNIYNRKNTLSKLFVPKVISSDPETNEFIRELEEEDVKSLGFTPNVSIRFNF